MKVELVTEPDQLTERAAQAIAEAIRGCVAERGRCLIAASGGTEPWAVYRRLATLPLPWDALHVFQVDERVAPAGHPERNWTHLQENLLRRVSIPRAQIHPMPVEEEPVEASARRYASVLTAVAGSPPRLDLVHLGLGDDGHTASLVPGDSVLEVADADVAVTACYRGWRRMTLTYPAIDRARSILWLVAGSGKARALEQLLAADPGIPASRVRRDQALLLTDRRTAGKAPPP